MMSDPLLALTLLVGTFAVCFFLGVPIAFSLVAGTLACIVLLGSFPMAYVAQTFFTQCNSFPPQPRWWPVRSRIERRRSCW